MTPNIFNYNFKNITVSGLPGSGSTTLLDMLREDLKMDGWRGFSGGEFMRAYAAEKGLFDGSKKTHHDASHYEDDFDRKVDYGMREKLENHQHWILESWLSGFLAQQVPGVLKVLMICSDDAVRIDRIVNRDQISIEEAKEHLHGRYQTNLKTWSKLYAQEWQEWVVKPGTRSAQEPIDFWHPDLYDLVIDTYSSTKKDTRRLVFDALKKTKTSS
jgi:cytidylate kinase